MVNRERFMLDVDSEGFPLVDTTMASYNIGKAADHPVVQAMLADHKCMKCANPLGWQEVDGLVLPRITWADEHDPFSGQRDKGDALRAAEGQSNG